MERGFFFIVGIHFTREGQSQHLKDYFSSRTVPSIFTSIEPVSLDQSNKTSWVFLALKSTRHFLPQSTVFCRSDSSSETNSSCYYISDAWSHLELRVVSSAYIVISQITSTGRSLMYSRKIAGPRKEPWGNPVLTGYSCEDLPSRTTQNRLLLRKEKIRPDIWLKIP